MNLTKQGIGIMALLLAITPLRSSGAATKEQVSEWNAIGVKCLREGNIKNAIVHFQASLKADPKNQDARKNLALIMMAAKRYQDARTLLAPCVEGPDAESLVLMVKLCQLEGNGKEREEWAKKAFAKVGDAKANLATSYLLQGLPDEAAAVYQQLLAAAPDNAEAQVSYARFLVATQKLKEGTALLKKWAPLATNDQAAWFDLSILQQRQGAITDALESVKKGLSRFPQNPVGWFDKGLICESAGNLDDAEAAYRQAVKLSPGYSDAWVNLGNLLEKRKANVEALVCFENAFKANPSSTLAQYDLGRALLASKQDSARAVNLLNRASAGKGPAASQADKLLKKLVAASQKKGGAE